MQRRVPESDRADAARRPVMRAAVAQRYGGPEVLTVAEVPVPPCGADEVLVEVAASAVCRGDVHLLTGLPYVVRLAGYGISRPKTMVPGQNVSGRVIAVGSSVTAFAIGDEVLGELPRGAFAEVVAAPARLLACKPQRLSHAEAAALPLSGITALQALRDAGGVRAGHSVLVNGASGGVGTLAVQIGRELGAEVTAVCSSRHADLVRGLGAVRVIDYTAQDFTRLAQTYDVVLDPAGNRSVRETARALKPDGVMVAVGELAGGRWMGPAARMIKVGIASALSRRQLRTFLAKPNGADLAVLAGMADAGRLRAVIDRTYPLDRIGEAVAHVLSGRVQGTTVIMIGPNA